MNLRSWPAAAIALTATAALCGALAGPAEAVPTQAGADRGGPATASNGADVTRIALTTKAPYQPEGNPHAYPPPPRGFQPVFTENVSRHGERDLTSSDDGDNLLALWQIAKTDGALTKLGQGLGPEITQLLAANAALGYGNLDKDGQQELAGLARPGDRDARAQLHPRVRQAGRGGRLLGPVRQ
jgi:hypothetical protein